MNLVERLRTYQENISGDMIPIYETPDVCIEAADRIEELEKERNHYKQKAEILADALERIDAVASEDNSPVPDWSQHGMGGTKMNLSKLSKLVGAVEKFPVDNRLVALYDYLSPMRIRKMLDLIEVLHSALVMTMFDLEGAEVKDEALLLGALRAYNEMNQEDV